MGEELDVGKEEGGHQEVVPSLRQPKGKDLGRYERKGSHPRREWGKRRMAG